MSKIIQTTHKFIKSNKYGYAVQLYRKEDGDIVYFAGYPDPFDLDKTGKPKKKRLKIGSKSEGITEQFVKNTRDEIVVKLRLGEIPDILQRRQTKEIFTFGKLVDLYFTKRIELDYTGSCKNINKDKSVLRNHLSQFLNTDPNSITDMDVIRLKAEKLKTLAPKTINNALGLLNAILKHGIDSNLINKMPKIEKINGIDNARERYFTKDEIEFILEYVSDNAILSMFVKLSLSTGGRLETIRSIKVKDINLSDRTISLVDFKGKAAGKNNATYIGFINQQLKNELAIFVAGLSPNSYIFCYEDGRRVGTDYIQNNLQRIFNCHFNQGLDSNDAKKRAVIHSLRHTFATQLAKKGIPIFTIQKLLNHSDIKMTMRYAKFSPENGKDAIETLDLF